MTYSEIIKQIEFLTDLGYGYYSGDSDKLDELTDIVNRVNSRIWHTIFMSTGNWQYDDSGNDKLPEATTDIESGVATYTLPSSGLTVHRIEVKRDGNWHRVKPFIKENIHSLDADKGEGMPSWYRLVGETISFIPTPDYDEDDAIKVYFDRSSADFSSDSLDDTPGFAKPYHEILAVKTALEILKVKQPNSGTMQVLAEDDQRLERNLIQYYGQRFKDYKPRVRRRPESFK